MPDRSAQLRRRLLATFRIEADEHLRAIGTELDAITATPDAKDVAGRLDTLFRVMHTIKGAARSVALGDVEALCHRCEALLRDLTKGLRQLDHASIAMLRESSDALAGLVARSSGSGAGTSAIARTAPTVTVTADASRAPAMGLPSADGGPMPAAGNAANPPAADRDRTSIRVEVGRLDHLVVLAEDLLIPKLAAAERVKAGREIAEGLRRTRATLRTNRRVNGRREAGAAVELLKLDDELRSIEGKVRRLTNALAADHKVLRSSVSDLFDDMRELRMMPAAAALAAFPRMVRDLCRATGKEAAWKATGAELEIDRKVLDIVKDPLIHLVRNAVDHGLESPDERLAAGKQREGMVSLRLERMEGQRIGIVVADDGRGISPAAIREAAVRSRALTAEQAAKLDDDEAQLLAFRAGVSTSPVITSISGHGLGLAIVRETIEQVDGRVIMQSKPGGGVTIRLEVPASIATYRGLLVRAAGTPLLWPADAIERAISVDNREATAALARGFLAYAGESLSFGRLSAILGLPQAAPAGEPARKHPCIVVRGGDRRGVLLVDEVVGETEVLVKELRPPLLRVRNVLATGLLGTGDLALVLRPSDVLVSIHAAPGEALPSAGPTEARPLRVLVVDDSITTRTMERNLFESAGYAVQVAADGIEAWNVLQTEEIDLVVSDVDMPHMDGFELTQRIRADAKLAHLPVVLVTALESREDRERGVRAGANAYVLKSAFNQSNLLEIVRRLT